MQLQNVGTIIASRVLTVKDQSKNVLVTIGKPQQYPDGSDYYCPFQITGLGDEEVKWAGGIDAVQALLIALEGIGILLNNSEECKKGQLLWIGSDEGNLGFPRHDSSGLLERF